MDADFHIPIDIAEESWKRARRKTLYQKVVCAITHCSVNMLSFEEVRDRLHLSQKHFRGLQDIPLDRIRGSVGRFDDFSSTFMPRKDHMEERWKTVYQLVAEGKAPPIEAFQVDQVYFVVDGNHRVSAARQQGFETIAANVTEFDAPAGFNPDEGIDQFLIESEKTDFLNQIDEKTAQKAEAIQFTCAGCYSDLKGQIDTYRQGIKNKTGKTVSFDQAFDAWHNEVYTPAVTSIRQDKLVNLFPERTEADLFIWSWQNSSDLEAEQLE